MNNKNKAIDMKRLVVFFVILGLTLQSTIAQNNLDLLGLPSTQAQVAYSLRRLSTSYSGYAIKVRRSSDNAEANVAFNGNVVIGTSTATFTPGVTVGASLGTARTGTISTGAAKAGTISIAINKTGTITVNINSQTVTGTSTGFTTELSVGDQLFNTSNVFIGVVKSVESPTSLTLSNYSTVTSTAISYRTRFASVIGTATSFTTELAVGDRLFSTTNSYLGIVTSIATNTSLSLNSRDAVASSGISFKGTSTTVTGSGTSFTSELAAGDLLISNNVTLGIVASVSSDGSLTLTDKAGVAVSSLSYKSTSGTIPFSTFYTGTSVYVNTWYDQSGNGRDAIQQATLTNQPRIVNSGTLQTVNAKPSMEFSSALSSVV